LEEAIARTREETKSVGRAAFLTPEEFIRLTNDINSHFLTKGFETSDFARSRDSGDSNNGFFTGSIHLLRGGPPVSRYFSLTTHVDCPSDANLRRWSEACATAVTCLLAGAEADDQKLVLVGFTDTMREVVARAYMKLRRKCRAYMLLTFDIPTKEEIASKLQPGDQVVLVTDVVSTGTLVQAVWNLVRRVGANVLGIASLVDARRVTASAETFMTFAGEEVRLVTASQLHAPARSQFELTDVEYWVDPVSLVPRPTKTWGWVPDLDTKIEKTIDMINDSQACSCGHVVDGTRHASVYVDLQKLLEVQDIAAQEPIAEVCRERLTRRGWKDFSPGIVLFPSGIARIESVAFESGPRETPVSSGLVTVYHTAVRTYVERLRRIWPQMTLIEVQRAFDPGGGSRCATTVDLPKRIQGNATHMVVADDGIWRGTTINALVQIALTIGAKKIFVVPLLSRVPPTVVGQFEHLHSVDAAPGSEVVEVCYAFPLLLPIPYYGAQDCPYEITVKRLEDRRSRIKPIRKVADQLVKSLRGHHPTQCPVHSVTYSPTWLRARSYVELASEHEGALEKLNKLIQEAEQPDELLALFSLFSEEWRLLGRARLRQSVQPTLKTRAEAIATSRDVIDSRVRAAALTVLRSLFCDNFVDLLPELIGIIVEDPVLLGRAVFQVCSLNERLRKQEECIRFLEEISSRGPTALAKHTKEWSPDAIHDYFELVTACKTLALELRASTAISSGTMRTCAIELLRLLRDDPTLRHRTRPFVSVLANSGASIHDLDAGNFQSLSQDWEQEHDPLLSGDVLPRTAAIRHLLLHTATHGRQIISPDLAFLEEGCEPFRNALNELSAGLQFLKEDTSSPIFKRGVVDAASRLMKDVLSEESTTLLLLEQLQQVQVGGLVNSFASEIAAHFAATKRKIKLTVDGLASVNPAAKLFCPQSVAAACTGNILDNLRRHAFPVIENAAEEDMPEIAICVEGHRSVLNEPMVTLSVRNNGSEMGDDIKMGKGGQRSAAALTLFGGEYFLPRNTYEQPLQVVHRVSFLSW
jgi:adenine/guanine phosphoribosyltransferase-like PRPP-binding protein